MTNDVYKYEILSHTADLKVRVFGLDKEELFLNAVLAMEDCLKPKIKKDGTKVRIRTLQIKSFNFETLLVDFLSEVLYLIQTNKEIYHNIKFEKFSDTEIKANLFSKKIESLGEDIKGVTYYDLTIQQQKNGMWEATILFDI